MFLANKANSHEMTKIHHDFSSPTTPIKNAVDGAKRRLLQLPFAQPALQRKHSIPPPIRVFKFDNFSDQPSGRIVDLVISEDELVLYAKTCEKNPHIETIFIDEIIDVFIGSHADSSKSKVGNDSQIQRIFAATFTTAACVLNDCIVTVMHGLDFVNPQSLVFLTKSADEAKVIFDQLFFT
uniref:PLC-beta PH domain-containing protein n=1 Tax=Acrobeloides nanus TaxID=290746 RepID=A0A914E4A5_9BILA